MKRNTAVLLAAWATACTVELPDGRDVRIVEEIRPTNHGAYVLIYRTALTRADCAAADKEIEDVWSEARSRAEKANASSAHVIAESTSGASAVRWYMRQRAGWKRFALKGAQCDTP